MKPVHIILLCNSLLLSGCATTMHSQEMAEVQSNVANCKLDDAQRVLNRISDSSLNYEIPSRQEGRSFPQVNGYPTAVASELVSSIKTAYIERIAKCQTLQEETSNQVTAKLGCVRNAEAGALPEFTEPKWFIHHYDSSRCPRSATGATDCTTEQDSAFGITGYDILSNCFKVESDRLTALEKDKSKEAQAKQDADAQAKIAYANSTAGISERLCNAEKMIRYFQAHIDKEHKIRKISGVVNLTALHEAGEAIQSWSDAESRLKDEYRKGSGGKTWGPDQCEGK